MKLVSAFSIMVLLLINTGCTSSDQEDYSEYEGSIKPIGITSFQYGTHTLETNDNFYALRSQKIDLSTLENKMARIWADRIEGYPVDGGPIYLEVKKAEVIHLDK